MDYPDPEEEYELMYQDEFELLRDMEVDITGIGTHPKSKRSLDFSTPKSSAISDEYPKQVESSNGVVDAALISLDVPMPVGVEDQCLERSKTATSKRTVEDLFGDITDLELEEQDVKRIKSSTTRDEELIQKILAGRQASRECLGSERILNRGYSPGNKTLYAWGGSLSRRVPPWPFIPLTDSSGERLYVRLRSDEFIDHEIAGLSAHGRSLGLLSVPYQTLWQQAQDLIVRQKERADVQLAEKLSRLEAGIVGDSEDLWVDRYQPHSYMELLSDEGTNRTLLRWLKMWDKVVFGRETKLRKKPKEDKKGGKVWQGPSEELDAHGRPRQLVALLCGPPGLGKTTLAHMVARHAGYNVVEVNASDDRSPDAFRMRLHAATEMRDVLGTNPHPNCLVLDEIDGAAAPAIEVLIKYVMGKDTGGRGKGKKKEGTGILRRPIICICNDPYGGALRALRSLALVIHMPPTSAARLAQRLLEVARREGIHTDLTSMLALAERAGGDVRTCLGVLHFYRGRSVRLGDVQTAAVGHKDVQKGLFSVWQEIFQIQRPKRRMCVAKPPKDGTSVVSSDLDTLESKFDEMSLEARGRRVLRTVQAHGDYERLAQGVYENFLLVNPQGMRLENVTQGLDWFCSFDLLSTAMHTYQSYVLMPYLPYAFVVWHVLFSTLAWPKLNYPSAGYEVSTKLARRQQTLAELVRGLAPGVRACCQASTLLLDTLPLLLVVLAPSLRTVNRQLYSSSERDILARVVRIMIDFGLTYTQERTADGSYTYRLDPDLEDLCHFPGIKQAQVVSYSVRQLLAREVELERLRQAEAALPPLTKPTQKPEHHQTKSSTAVPNHLQTLAPRTIAKIDVESKDFFGRVIPSTAEEKAAAGAKADEMNSRVWFHFKEGYSNAVRRAVYMRDLV